MYIVLQCIDEIAAHRDASGIARDRAVRDVTPHKIVSTRWATCSALMLLPNEPGRNPASRDRARPADGSHEPASAMLKVDLVL
jgi:hypothetical protein